jgi:hypothetical protein
MALLEKEATRFAESLESNSATGAPAADDSPCGESRVVWDWRERQHR